MESWSVIKEMRVHSSKTTKGPERTILWDTVKKEKVCPTHKNLAIKKALVSFVFSRGKKGVTTHIHPQKSTTLKTNFLAKFFVFYKVFIENVKIPQSSVKFIQ